MIKEFNEFLMESVGDDIKSFGRKIYNTTKINAAYIMTGYKKEFMDLVNDINSYSKGEITKKELTHQFVSFLKLLGITSTVVIHSFLTIAIIIAFKRWGLTKFLPDAFQDEDKKIDEKIESILKN